MKRAQLLAIGICLAGPAAAAVDEESVLGHYAEMVQARHSDDKNTLPVLQQAADKSIAKSKRPSPEGVDEQIKALGGGVPRTRDGITTSRALSQRTSQSAQNDETDKPL